MGGGATSLRKRRPGAARAALPAVCLAICLAATAACGAKYSLRTAESGVALQWPYQPHRAKVTYVRSLTGLARAAGAGSALRAVVYGRQDQDSDAFVLPVAVAVGGDGRLAVADMGRRCVHLYLPGEGKYVRITGSKQRRILSPVALAFDDRLGLYLSDSSGAVFAFAPDGSTLRVIEKAGDGTLRRPTGIAWSPSRGLLYVVDTLADEVHAYRPDGALELSFGGRGDGEGRFNHPTHIFRSPAGELFVTDSLNFRVAIFDEEGHPRGSFGHHGDGSGDFAMPKGLAVDADGVVYVADSLFDNVQLFDREGGFLLTLGRRGVDAGEFWLPSGIAIDADNQLYVCDTYNRRIQVFRLARGYAPNEF